MVYEIQTTKSKEKYYLFCIKNKDSEISCFYTHQRLSFVFKFSCEIKNSVTVSYCFSIILMMLISIKTEIGH